MIAMRGRNREKEERKKVSFLTWEWINEISIEKDRGGESGQTAQNIFERELEEKRREAIIDQANEPQASGWDLSLQHTHLEKGHKHTAHVWDWLQNGVT